MKCFKRLVWLKQSGGQCSQILLSALSALPQPTTGQPSCQTVNHAIYSLLSPRYWRWSSPNISPFHPTSMQTLMPTRNLTLAQRVLKKFFQIPLTDVTAFFELSVRWVGHRSSLCVKAALQVLSTFPPCTKCKENLSKGKAAIFNICSTILARTRPSKMDFCNETI